MESDEMLELAERLAFHLHNEGNNFIKGFTNPLEKHNSAQEEQGQSFASVITIVSSFQIVHVMSYIYQHKYLKEYPIHDFTNLLIRFLHGELTEDFMKYLKQYQDNKQKDILEQLKWFSEDVPETVRDAGNKNIADNTDCRTCRNGCSYYDPLTDVNTGEFKEFCWNDPKSVRISSHKIFDCRYFKPKTVISDYFIPF